MPENHIALFQGFTQHADKVDGIYIPVVLKAFYSDPFEAFLAPNTVKFLFILIQVFLNTFFVKHDLSLSSDSLRTVFSFK